MLRIGRPDRRQHGKIADDEHAYLHVLRVLMISFLKGTAPIMAVEVARRAIPGHVRPSFTEVEKLCRGGGASPKLPRRLRPTRPLPLQPSA